LQNLKYIVAGGTTLAGVVVLLIAASYVAYPNHMAQKPLPTRIAQTDPNGADGGTSGIAASTPSTQALQAPELQVQQQEAADAAAAATSQQQSSGTPPPQ
jgi:hypothetical protein